MGHGLGQPHFGTAFQTLANGKLHFAPRRVMNAPLLGAPAVAVRYVPQRTMRHVGILAEQLAAAV
jgi:hypothetical protein